MPINDEKPCTGGHGCKGTMFWARGCGAMVCDTCDAHDGLARCFCGWSSSGGNGREELEEMGEVIDEDGGFLDTDDLYDFYDDEGDF